MEDRTQFNIDNKISDWKASLLKNSNLTIDNVDELESHLLDEIDELRDVNLSNEECLLVAKSRIGATETIESEYAKVNKSMVFMKKINPYLKGALIFLAFTTLVEFSTKLLILVSETAGLNNGTAQIISILIFAFLTLTFFIVLYRKYKSTNQIFKKVLNVPRIVGFIIICRVMSVFSLQFIANTVGLQSFGSLMVNLNVFTAVFELLIITTACIVFYKSRKIEKLKIVE